MRRHRFNQLALVAGGMLVGVIIGFGAGGEWSADAVLPYDDRVVVDRGIASSEFAGTSPTVPPTTNAPASLVEPSVTPGDEVRVVSVTDGDTIDILIAGVPETVRLLGINAPESSECLGTDSTARLAGLLSGADVVTLVEASPRRDMYGRLLTDVAADGLSMADMLVREGLALSVAYGRSSTDQAVLAELQAHARAERIGMWSPTSCGTMLSVGLTISHIEFDAPGNDAENRNDEWIEILAARDADLTGWSIRDESSSHRFRFPDGFSASSGQPVIVRSGCGTDTTVELFWCNSGSAIWNNSGDTGFLIDPAGTFADSWSY